MDKTKDKLFIKERARIFGRNMRGLRKQRGFSTDNLAHFLGVSSAYVGLLERGDRSPSFDIFLKVCNFFGEGPESLLAPDKFAISVREAKKPLDSPSKEEVKAKHDLIINMLETFDHKELDYVMGVIKNFKGYAKARRND